jgi:hypothetical protein
MSGDKSNWSGHKRDFLCKGPSAWLLWCVPWIAFAFGFSVRPGLRTVLWTTSLAVMGVACLVNASRCGRVHCWFTGPFFILGALTPLGYGLGFLPLGPSGWSWICLGTIIGAIGLTFIPELFLGRYRLGGSSSA